MIIIIIIIIIIPWELYKKLEFDHTNKWYIQNPESVQENEMHKFL